MKQEKIEVRTGKNGVKKAIKVELRAGGKAGKKIRDRAKDNRRK